MKKHLLCAVFGMLFTNLSFAQLENKGWWTRDLFTFSYFKQDESLSDNRLERTYQRYFTQPEVGYVLNKRWLLGLVMQYEFIADRYTVPADRSGLKASYKRFYGAGPLLRYYIPLTKRASFMPEVFAFWSHQIQDEFYTNVGLESKTTTSLDIFGLGANPTIVYFLTRDLAFSITFVNIGYYSSRESRSFTLAVNPQQWLFGVEYYFEKKKGTPAN